MSINDKEEMALTVNGKKAKLKKEDFKVMGETLGIPEKAIENSFARIAEYIPELKDIISNSFLSGKLKKIYKELLDSRIKVLASGQDNIQPKTKLI